MMLLFLLSLLLVIIMTISITAIVIVATVTMPIFILAEVFWQGVLLRYSAEVFCHYSA